MYWAEFLTVALIHLLAVASPGPDFAVVVRESVTHGRRAGTWTAFGVGAQEQFRKLMSTAVDMGMGGSIPFIAARAEREASSPTLSMISSSSDPSITSSLVPDLLVWSVAEGSYPSRVPKTERSFRIRKIAIPARTIIWIGTELMGNLSEGWLSGDFKLM